MKPPLGWDSLDWLLEETYGRAFALLDLFADRARLLVLLAPFAGGAR